MRTRDIDTSGKIWEYRPESHKTEHHGKERVIFLGPRAQEIVRPFLKNNLDPLIGQDWQFKRWVGADSQGNSLYGLRQEFPKVQVEAVI